MDIHQIYDMILTNLLATTKAIMIVKMMATPPVAQFVIPESVRSKEEDEMTLMMLKTLAGLSISRAFHF